MNMKKFLIFLVAIITTVCIGITFYQFAKNDEVIKVNTQTIYINYGDTLSLDDIGFVRKEASKETKINFNAGGDEVTSIIAFDELSQSYIPTAKGGATTIKITTTNRKYKSFNINVVVGIGTEEFPYYITNEAQLFEVTNSHIDDNACFELVQDIKLNGVQSPIGLIDGDYREFTGKFNGNYHTISNLQIESCDYAGLFAIMGASSQVYNLNIANAVIEGDFESVGAVAGKCFGTINKVVVSNATITNAKADGSTGAVVGTLETDNLNNTTAGILRTSAYTDQNKLITANGNLGGLAGSVNSALIHACYTRLCLKNNSTLPTGGLVGALKVNNDTYIRESYTLVQMEAPGVCGNIIGSVNLTTGVNLEDVNKDLVLVGLYYEKGLNNFAGVDIDPCNFATVTNFAVNGKSSTEMKDKDTYIYYVNSANNIIYWDKVWYLVDGEYPTLTFVNKFDDIVLDGGNQNIPNIPDDPTTPDISIPETPSTTAIVISNKDELLNAFQGKSFVSGNYILNADIDLGGINWTPVAFSGTFKSSENKNYTISNFKIVGDNLLYAGFFYNLASSTISNITFNNVQVVSTTANESAGIVVGYIRGNTSIVNVDVVNAEISATSKYSAGIAGYITNIVKIEKCNIQSLTIKNTSSNVGGIAGYSSNDTYIVDCKVKNSNTLSGINRVGGIVATNHGYIYDCLFNGNIEASGSTTSGYVGGLAGINHSTILDSATFAEISVTNSQPSNSGIYYFVGGLAGYNVGNISNSSAYADEYAIKQSSGVVYVAGLTGYNSGKLEYCVAEVNNVGSAVNNIYTAGLTAFNYGGNIFGCFTFGNLNGYQVSGLVGVNTNDGTIDSCMTGLNDIDRATYKGVQIASLVYEISSGSISNSIVNANLNCINENGWVAGFAGFMPCNADKFGVISHSISNVSFSGVGTKYLDIVQEGLMKKKRTTGTVTNCVITEEAKVPNVVISKYSKFLWMTKKAGSQSNYIVANATQLVTLETYLDPNNCSFDIGAGLTTAKWLYINNTRLPIPSTFLDVFGYDIIGLG